jgi:pimeloyl-ACP methyl ester carboxylesterase
VDFVQSFVELNGCKVRLRRAGKGRPLLFLHGASGMPAILPCLHKLAEKFDVVVPEHPGYGQSDEPAWLDNIHDMAYFYLEFLDKLDLREVYLIGNSMGGWIALEMAVRSTARIKSMVVISPAGVKTPGVLPADTFLMSPEEQVRALIHDQKLAEARLAEPVSPEALDVALKNKHTTARLAWEPRFHDPHLPKWLHRIGVPVTIVWGKEDRILPVGMAKRIHDLIPGSKLEVIAEAGHLPHVEKMDRFLEIVCR